MDGCPQLWSCDEDRLLSLAFYATASSERLPKFNEDFLIFCQACEVLQKVPKKLHLHLHASACFSQFDAQMLGGSVEDKVTVDPDGTCK